MSSVLKQFAIKDKVVFIYATRKWIPVLGIQTAPASDSDRNLNIRINQSISYIIATNQLINIPIRPLKEQAI